ncbi:MAG: hypothetical protein GF320_09600, partial [Armatimonadia bacterium]|nr:hypothetical protein [Armatimonadia bacterium]
MSPDELCGAEAGDPVLSVDPTSLSFGSSSTQKTLSITNTGEGTLTWSVADDQSWLSVSSASGTGDGTVSVTVNRSGLAVGGYTGTVTVSSNDGTVPVSVSMTVPDPGGRDFILNPKDDTMKLILIPEVEAIFGLMATRRSRR